MIALANLGSVLRVEALDDALVVGPLPAAPESLDELAARWPSDALAVAGGVQIALDVEQVLERGLAEIRGDSVAVPWSAFDAVMELGLSIATRWAEGSPFLLSIDRRSDIGQRDFQYRYEYVLGERPSALTRVGYFLRREHDGRLFVLDSHTYALVQAMDAFNAASSSERGPTAAWSSFATVKAEAAQVGAELDAYLAKNSVIIPSSIALDYAIHEDGSISFVPRSPEIAGDELSKAFQRSPNVEDLYSWDGEEGRRVRVLLQPRHREVLRRMKQVRCATGDVKAMAVSRPEAFFDGVLDDVEIKYGPRVVGVGEFEFARAPSAPSGGSFLDEVAGSKHADEGDPPVDRARSINVRRKDGGWTEIRFPNGKKLAAFREAVAEGLVRGASAIDYDGVPVAVDGELLDALRRDSSGQQAKTRAAAGKYLLIYTDESEVQGHDEEGLRAPSEFAGIEDFELPRSLNTPLKNHQVEGVRWLSRCASVAGRRGALLADDMGLGKTLQVLTHLARLIESGAVDDGPNQNGNGPWRPILIIAPLILVENETWIQEMRARFAFDGNVFEPVLTLYGSAINRAKRTGMGGGRETTVGAPSLDPAELMKYRVVITTYETVVSYQHSFAQYPGGRPLWSVVVTDEAQRYKTMNTKTSHAIKATTAKFHIASTGTPVENRLLDLWNIVDAFQPALLGSASDFSKTFETPLAKDSGAKPVLDSLRERLRYGQQDAYLVRRDKSQLRDLPSKSEKRISSQMSKQEHELHAECVASLKGDVERGKHLAVLQRLSALSQHPLIGTDDLELDPTALIESSPKLQSVLSEIEHIRQRGEKVILFARLIAAQQILAVCIKYRFGIDVPIVNGSTSRGEVDGSSSATSRARENRKRLLDRFRSRDGFGAIVLSPFVAGVGLTLTEANHVIHYGRWWNPAVENQATDRAYRIGQTRPVTVYYPISEDPWGTTGATFDQALDRLIMRKVSLAKDFLHPTNDEDELAAELKSSLVDADPAEKSEPVSGSMTREEIERLSASDFEALVAAAYETPGSRAILTATSNDGGADVIVVRSRGGMLIQAKHHPKGQAEIGAIADVFGAIDTYTARLTGTWAGMVVSSGRFSREVRSEAAARGVTLVDGSGLAQQVERRGIRLRDVVKFATDRCRSFDEGIRRAARLLQYS